MNSLLQQEIPDTSSSTPILDSGVLPARLRNGTPKVVATGLALGVALMAVLAVLGGMWYEQWPVVFLLLFMVAIAIHEIGHLIAGWSLGFHFASLHIGPLSLESQYGIPRVKLSLDIMALGLAGMYPDKVRRLRRRLLICIAGGPAANLLTVLVVIVVSNVVSTHPGSAVATAVGQFAAISLILAMVSLVPLSSNDGALIEMLLCAPSTARRLICTSALGAQYNQGLRPRNWKRTWVRAATSISDRSIGDFYANWMAYLVESDRKEPSVASRHLERCLEITPAMTNSWRDLVAQEAAVYSAWFRMDPTLAEKWLRQLKSRRSVLPVRQARIEVALDCARGDFRSALHAWNRGLLLLEHLPMKPSNMTLSESWREWLTEIQERQLHSKMAAT